MQYLLRVGFGPSSNTWPMCALHLAHLTSVRTRSGFLRSNNRLVPDFFFLRIFDFGFYRFISFVVVRFVCFVFSFVFRIFFWIFLQFSTRSQLLVKMNGRKMRGRCGKWMNEWEENRFTLYERSEREAWRRTDRFEKYCRWQAIDFDARVSQRGDASQYVC